MPVVSISNSSSPIIDSYNGFISKDIKYLREKIKLLLENQSLAVELGKNARKPIEEKFNIRRFLRE